MEVLASGDSQVLIVVAHLREVPEGIAFDRGLLCALGSAAAVADLRLRSEPAVAKDRARVVAAPDGVIASGEFLEAEKCLPRILRPHSKGEGKPRDGAQLTITGVTQHRRVGVSVEPAWRDIARAQAIDGKRAAVAGRSNRMQTLPEFEQAGDVPRRLGRG